MLFKAVVCEIKGRDLWLRDASLEAECIPKPDLSQPGSYIPVHSSLFETIPEPSLQDLMEGAMVELVQTNLSAVVARALADQKAHFDAEWDHQMNVMQQEAASLPMDTREPVPRKEKRKPSEQMEPAESDEREGLETRPSNTAAPTTPPGIPPSSDTEARAAEASTLGAYGSASAGGGSVERVGPY